MALTRTIEVYAARDGMEAHFLRSLLEDEGIDAQVVGDGLVAALGDIPFGMPTAPRIWVQEEDAARARQLILDWEQSRRNRSEADAEEA